MQLNHSAYNTYYKRKYIECLANDLHRYSDLTKRKPSSNATSHELNHSTGTDLHGSK